MPSPLTEYDPEWETFEAEAPAWLGESSYEVLGETDELELATELLAVTDERELDQFLGNLIRNDRAHGRRSRAVAARAGDRPRTERHHQANAAARRHRARDDGRRPARRVDRRRACQRCGPRARPRARGPEPRGPGARSDQAVRALRQRRGEERGVGARFRAIRRPPPFRPSQRPRAAQRRGCCHSCFQRAGAAREPPIHIRHCGGQHARHRPHATRSRLRGRDLRIRTVRLDRRNRGCVRRNRGNGACVRS